MSAPVIHRFLPKTFSTPPLGVIGLLSATLCSGLLTTTPAQAAIKPSVYEASIDDLQSALAAGTLTSRQLVEQYMARIQAYDQRGPALNAIVTLNPNALKEAERLDEERRTHGPRGPLHGIPIVVKDNYDTRDMPTSGGTLALANHQPVSDAYQVKRLREAGAIILGKTTLHELAAGVTTVSSLTGYTLNAYDPTRAPGGSSGGTAVAVAASFAAAGMGSDTCGSIRIPAAYQNLVGLRTTRGLASRSGVIPLSSTQDVAAPLARTVKDLAIMLDATVGSDTQDPSTADAQRHVPASYLKALDPSVLKGARIGVVRALFGATAEDAEVTAVIDQALKELEDQGAELVNINIPELEGLLRDSSIIAYEFKYDLAAYLEKQPDTPVHSLGEILDKGMDHYLLDTGLRTREGIDLKKVSNQQALNSVLEKRVNLRRVISAVLQVQHLDALAYPTTQRKPALIAEPQFGVTNCQLSATTGLPAMALPAGWTVDKLPVGLELLGAEYAETRLLNLAYGWEQTTQPRRPPFTTPDLISGSPPGPLKFEAEATATKGSGVKIQFIYAPLTGQLDYTADAHGIAGDDIIGVTLQRRNGDNAGPIIANLLKKHVEHMSGHLILKGNDRDDLLDGHLLVRLYTTDAPLGASLQKVVQDTARPR